MKASKARGERTHLRRLLGGLALAGLPVACVPLDDLAAYSEGVGEPLPDAVVGPSSGDEPGETQVVEGLEGEGPAPGSQGSSSPSTESSPDDIALSDPRVNDVATGTGTEPVPAPADAGVPSPPDSVDAARPPVPIDAADERPPECGVGRTRGPRGKCFVAVETALAWQEARNACQALGAGWDLATARSSEDNQLLSSLAAFQVWLGATDSTSEGIWAWVADGLELWSGDGETGVELNGAFTNWFDDEPNGEDSSDCLRMLVDGTWADLECGEARGSLCEGPPLVR